MDENFENENKKGEESEKDDADISISFESVESDNTETDIVKENDLSSKKPKKGPLREIGEWVLAIAIALAVTLVLKTYVFDTVVVDGESMLHTLLDGDRLVMVKLGYEPKRGDVIVLDSNYKMREEYIAYKYENYPDFSSWDEFKLRYISFSQRRQLGIAQRCYVKRVIGVAGDVIELDSKSGVLKVNGEVVDEPYLDTNTPSFAKDASILYPHVVSEGCVFVMGDNRENSTDSRFSSLGDVPLEAVLGKVSFRFWPFSAVGTID